MCDEVSRANCVLGVISRAERGKGRSGDRLVELVCSKEKGMKQFQSQMVRLVALAAFAAGAFLWTTATAEEPPDCSGELEQIPRDGTVVKGSEVLVSYTGSIVYGGLHGASPADLKVDGADGWAVESVEEERLQDARSQVGARVSGLSEGEFRWAMGDGAEAAFSVESVDTEIEPPVMGEGEVEAKMELLAYPNFPVLFREWTLRFPRGESETTAAENLRYLVEFSWGDGEAKMTRRVLVTPPADDVGEVVEIELGGRSDRCRHDEPDAPLMEETRIEVYAVDVAGNLSRQSAHGVFEGVPADQLADAYEEFNAVIESLEGGDEDTLTTEEMVAKLEAKEEAEEESANGCSSVDAKKGGGVMFLVLIGLISLVRRGILRR